MDAFDTDREDVIKRARASGVEYMITIGSDMKGSLGAVELAGRYDSIFASIGIHPHDASSFNQGSVQAIKELAQRPRVVAIGETGLDYHYMHSPGDIQIQVFKQHICIARELSLPLIVHSRDAAADTLDILRSEAKGTRGVLHCFSGDSDMAKKVMEMGFFISIAGTVTFKNAKMIKEVAAIIPDEYLMLETDAPYLSPEPMRGKRNEPSFVLHTARAIADIRGVTVEDIARITTVNAIRLFHIGELPEQGEIAYKIRQSLYLNVTNRCTNRCGFCVRFHTDYVKGHNLRLGHEPAAEELIHAIGNPCEYREIVFCGYGEPFLRLDVIKEVAAWIKQNGGRVRINTNGHGNMIHGRNILPELSGLVDSLSISLDADDREKYERICAPSFKDAFEGVLDFIKEAKRYVPQIVVTVVDLPDVDIQKCRRIADELGVSLRVRHLDAVG